MVRAIKTGLRGESSEAYALPHPAVFVMLNHLRDQNLSGCDHVIPLHGPDGHGREARVHRVIMAVHSSVMGMNVGVPMGVVMACK
jgi:hypothetical protein